MSNGKKLLFISVLLSGSALFGGRMPVKYRLPALTPVFVEIAPGPVVKAFHHHQHGTILTDSKGITLYTYDKDKGEGISMCYGICAEEWPPLIIKDIKLEGRLGEDRGMVVRKGGAHQVTYKGAPLYYYKKDQDPKDTEGLDQEGWSIARP